MRLAKGLEQNNGMRIVIRKFETVRFDEKLQVVTKSLEAIQFNFRLSVSIENVSYVIFLAYMFSILQFLSYMNQVLRLQWMMVRPITLMHLLD